MTLLEKFYPESAFGGFSDVDGTVRFYSRVNSLLRHDMVALDVGCGRGEYQDDDCLYRRNLRILKGKCKKVVGIDVDSGAKTNPFIDEFHMIDGDRWAIEDQSIDVIVCDCVLEHVEFPAKLFLEFRRVLKVGGIVCARTPNLLSYFGIISNMIPNRYHVKIVARLQDSRKAEDIFPKFYNCNTARTMRKLMRSNQFDGVVFSDESEPAYFSFSTIAYGLAKAFHALTPKFFSTQLYMFAIKRATPR